MKAAIFTEFAEDLTNIKISEVPIPTANETHCVVKIVTSAINPVDTKIASGVITFWPTTLPFVSGYDCAGIVHELPVGYSGTDFKVGDRVFTCNWGVSMHWDNDATSQGGAFAEYGLFPIHKIAKFPESVSFDAAAASALVALTAYQSLFECLNLQPGQRILVIGGPGAVGNVGVQLAKNLGCWVATTTSTRNESLVAQLGVDKIIDYSKSNWWEDEDLKDLDGIFDAIGEPELFQRAHNNGVVRQGGSIVSILWALKDFEEHHGEGKRYRNLSNFCLHHSSEQLEIIGGLIAAGKLHIPIDGVFSFDQEGVDALFHKQKSGKSNGKNILRISSI